MHNESCDIIKDPIFDMMLNHIYLVLKLNYN